MAKKGHKGCPCCSTRNRAEAKYTWEHLSLDGTKHWNKVTVPDGSTFNADGFPSNWYRHHGIGLGSAVFPHGSGGVLVSGSHTVGPEYGAEIGTPAEWIVTSRDIDTGDLVATIDIPNKVLSPSGNIHGRDHFLGRLGPDRIAIARAYPAPGNTVEYVTEVYDAELNYEWEVPGMPIAMGYTSGVMVFLILVSTTGTIFSYENVYSLVSYDETGAEIGNGDVSYGNDTETGPNANNVVSSVIGNGFGGLNGLLSVDGSVIVLRFKNNPSNSIDGAGKTYDAIELRSTAGGGFVSYFRTPLRNGVLIGIDPIYGTGIFGPPPSDPVVPINIPTVIWSAGATTGAGRTPGAPSSPMRLVSIAEETVNWFREVGAGHKVVWASDEVYFELFTDRVQKWTQDAMDWSVMTAANYRNGTPFAISEDIIVITSGDRVLVIDSGVVEFDGINDDFYALETSKVCDADGAGLLGLWGARANHEFGARVTDTGGPPAEPPPDPDPTGACCCTDGVQCIEGVTESECDDYVAAHGCLTDAAVFLPGEICTDTCLPE